MFNNVKNTGITGLRIKNTEEPAVHNCLLNTRQTDCHKQIHISKKLFSYKSFVKSINKTNPYDYSET